MQTPHPALRATFSHKGRRTPEFVVDVQLPDEQAGYQCVSLVFLANSASDRRPNLSPHCR
jgi:hypothetical protein